MLEPVSLCMCHAKQVAVTLSPGVPKIVHFAVEDSLWLQKSRPGMIPSWGILVTSPLTHCGSGNAMDLELHNSHDCCAGCYAFTSVIDGPNCCWYLPWHKG